MVNTYLTLQLRIQNPMPTNQGQTCHAVRHSECQDVVAVTVTIVVAIVKSIKKFMEISASSSAPNSTTVGWKAGTLSAGHTLSTEKFDAAQCHGRESDGYQDHVCPAHGR
jgi:hypothetical protein